MSRPWRGPMCPKCLTQTGAPMRTHHRAGEYGRDKNLVCHACGTGWTGTASEVAQADREEERFQRREERERRDAKKREKAAATLAAYKKHQAGSGW